MYVGWCPEARNCTNTGYFRCSCATTDEGSRRLGKLLAEAVERLAVHSDDIPAAESGTIVTAPVR